MSEERHHLDIRTTALEELDEIVVKMTSVEWQLDMAMEPPERQLEAKRELLRAQQARLKLANAELAKIVHELEVEEDAIRSGSQHVAELIRRGEKVENVLTAVSGFVNTLGRIVPLA